MFDAKGLLVGQKPSRRAVLGGLGAAVAATALPTSRARAADTGTVTVLTWETYHDDAWLAEYTARTGVKVNAVRAGSVDEMYAIARSGSVNPDLVFFDTGSTPRYIEAGLLDAIDVSRVANLESIIPSIEWRKFNDFNGTVYGVPYCWGTEPLMYDADKMDKPDSWAALWDPAHTGRVSTFDDAYLNIPIVAMKVGAADPYNLTEDEFGKVADALRELRPQIRTMARGFDDMANIFMAGDADIAYCQNIAIAFDLRGRGRNVQVVYPKEGTPAWVDNAILTKTAGQRQEVYDFISEGLTPAWQARFIGTYGANGILSEADAKAGGVSDEVLAKSEIPLANDAAFWTGMSVLQTPEDFDRRLELWNDFKAGML